jgi:hypothetical protein
MHSLYLVVYPEINTFLRTTFFKAGFARFYLLNLSFLRILYLLPARLAGLKSFNINSAKA